MKPNDIHRGNKRYILTLAAIVAMQLPLFARTESESRKLTADETYGEVLEVAEGVTLDLNGCTLTVAGLSGSGSITSSSLKSGVLCVNSEADTSNDGVAIHGNVKFVKDGGGTFTAAKSNQTYWGGTEVRDGTLKRGVLYGAFGGVNLVKNGSFDEGTPGSGAANDAVWATTTDWPANPYWTVSSTINNHGGLTKAGNNFVASGTDVGTYAVVLRSTATEDAYIRQTIDVPRAGTYSFAFTHIQLWKSDWSSMCGATVNAVLRYGEDKIALTPSGVVARDTAGTRFATTVEIAEAGEYVLEFNQTSTSTKNTILDDVELVFIPNLVKNGSFDEGAPGSNDAADWADTTDWLENPYWTVSSIKENHGGLTKAGTDYIASGTDVGKYAVVLRSTATEDAYIRQTIDVPRAGTYSFAFTYIQLARSGWAAMRDATVYAVLRRGEDEIALTPSGVVATKNAGERFETTVEIVEAGEYVLEFNQTSTSTKNTILDDVELVYTPVADIIVNSGASVDLDFDGTETTATRYPVVLAGGTLRKQGNSWLEDLQLTDDSTIAVTVAGSIGKASGAAASFDLGGRELSVDIGAQFLRIYNCSIANGTLKTSGGELRLGNTERGTIVATGISLEANSPINMIQDVDVEDYTANYAGTGNSGTAALNVYGTFSPVGSGYYGCTLHGGSTVNLGGWSGDVPLSGVKVADGESAETITISLDPNDSATKSWARGRKYLLEWTTAPENIRFELDGPSSGRFKLSPEEGGLRLLPAGGLIVIIE